MRLPALLLLSTLASSAMAAAGAGPIPIIQDDYPRARAEAIERKLPLFVEVWAPW